MTQENKKVSIAKVYKKIMCDENKAPVIEKCVKDKSKTPQEWAVQHNATNPVLFAAVVEHGRMKARIRRRRERSKLGGRKYRV